jgi:hypothetical protein
VCGPKRSWLALTVLGFCACETSLGTRADVGAHLDASRLDAAGAVDAHASSSDAAAALDVPALDAAPPLDDASEAPADAGPSCPPPGPMDCSMGPGTGEGDECTLGTSCFLRDVQSAIAAVVRDNPSWFDASAGPTHVLAVEDYMNAVVAALNAGGLCAIRDPNAGDEITVKWNNVAAENFDILTASEDVRSGGGIYTSTCAPAWW